MGERDKRGRVWAATAVCPCCEGRPSEIGCLHCHGQGITDDVAGWEPHELEELPRPKAVMPGRCGDCATRFGSPEEEGGDPACRDLTRPFFCHWGGGFREVEGRYVPVAQMPDGTPVGALVCAGWWNYLTGRQHDDDRGYQEPGEQRAGAEGDVPR
ncbi:hypothetical protein ACFC1T_09395 [Kitasatospora sp. NPDC056076]|uniref:hypothetical protein n=1 Tax=Kitasatospora sp. NPDC056076 TaxID=3345703 RepID=UPI0035D621DC